MQAAICSHYEDKTELKNHSENLYSNIHALYTNKKSILFEGTRH